MTIEHHKFANEFSQFREHIHKLKVKDAKFAALMKEYDETDDEIYRIEQEIETPSDMYTTALKINRVDLKDILFSMVSSYEDSNK